eukprot:4430522-Lingulodinium_polyedra.AAC.1
MHLGMLLPGQALRRAGPRPKLVARGGQRGRVGGPAKHFARTPVASRPRAGGRADACRRRRKKPCG